MTRTILALLVFVMAVGCTPDSHEFDDVMAAMSIEQKFELLDAMRDKKDPLLCIRRSVLREELARYHISDRDAPEGETNYCVGRNCPDRDRDAVGSTPWVLDTMEGEIEPKREAGE